MVYACILEFFGYVCASVSVIQYFAIFVLNDNPIEVCMFDCPQKFFYCQRVIAFDKQQRLEKLVFKSSHLFALRSTSFSAAYWRSLIAMILAMIGMSISSTIFASLMLLSLISLMRRIILLPSSFLYCPLSLISSILFSFSCFSGISTSLPRNNSSFTPVF